MARNTTGLPSGNDFKGALQSTEAAILMARKLSRLSNFSASLIEAEIGDAAIDGNLAAIRAKLNDLQADINAWLALTNS